MKRFLKISVVTIASILGLLLIAVEFTQRVPLPNGLYIYKIPFIPASLAGAGFYIYNQDDELIVDDPVDLICFNDGYLEGTFSLSRPSGSAFIYEITTKKVFTSIQPEYFLMSKKSGLSGSEYGCDGHIKGNIGTNLLWMKPWLLIVDRRLKMLRGSRGTGLP